MCIIWYIYYLMLTTPMTWCHADERSAVQTQPFKHSMWSHQRNLNGNKFASNLSHELQAIAELEGQIDWSLCLTYSQLNPAFTSTLQHTIRCTSAQPLTQQFTHQKLPGLPTTQAFQMQALKGNNTLSSDIWVCV